MEKAFLKKFNLILKIAFNNYLKKCKIENSLINDYISIK